MYGSSEKNSFWRNSYQGLMPGGSCICRIFNVTSAYDINFVTNKNKLNYFEVEVLWNYTHISYRSVVKVKVVSDSLQPQVLCSPWNSSGQNTGVGSRSLPQGIFPTQGLNPGLPQGRQILYQLSHKGSPSYRLYVYEGDHIDQ